MLPMNNSRTSTRGVAARGSVVRTGSATPRIRSDGLHVNLLAEPGDHRSSGSADHEHSRKAHHALHFRTAPRPRRPRTQIHPRRDPRNPVDAQIRIRDHTGTTDPGRPPRRTEHDVPPTGGPSPARRSGGLRRSHHRAPRNGGPPWTPCFRCPKSAVRSGTREG